MSWTRRLIIAFWVFVGIMLIYSFYNYNNSVTEISLDHPKQTQFIFLPKNAVAVAPAPAVHEGAFVEQTKYTVKSDEPEPGSFTVYVTLKNEGNARATNVEIHVRPYRGMRVGNEDVGHSELKILDDDDPLAQYGSWISFPSLAPGESSTQSTVFLNHEHATPVVFGVSDTGVPGQGQETLTPEINYETEKAK
jgi:hypothetical protein